MTKLPFSSIGLHPDQVVALREATGLSSDGFAQLFGTDVDLILRWEGEGVSSGPHATAVRAVAAAIDFDFPEISGAHSACTICDSPSFHFVCDLPVCRSCFLTPIESMLEVGFEVEQQKNSSERTLVEITAPKTWDVTLPPSTFGPEDWGTAVKKLRYDEPQVGHASFDEEVFIGFIEDDVVARLEDPVLRRLIAELVEHGELEMIGHRLRLLRFRRDETRPHHEAVLRAGLLIRRLGS